MAESDMGLDNKGSFVKQGDIPQVIDSGMPTGGSPGNGELSGQGYAGERNVSPPVPGRGPIK